MTAVQTTTRPAFFHPASIRFLLALAIVLSVGGFAQVASAPSASAAFSAAKGQQVVSVAATRKGAAYRWGAMGPRTFDCSGLTKWSFARVGKTLPRTSRDQYRATVRVAPWQRRAGDLVFFLSGGRVYHVGIYAGGNQLWDAPKPGGRVTKRTIWTTRVAYGRVR
jgi:cell wall-associated NlpC family hydrolase